MKVIEILMATMFREDLSFLEPIFADNDLSDFQILIVNQTDEDKQLKSDLANVRVINSFERGSPASRNLAIANAKGDICLMADDDIVYKPNLKKTILEAYDKHPEVDFISFEAVNEHEKLQANYPDEGVHDEKSLYEIYTWIITFKREVFKERSIFFNHHFGVGSTFKGSTEYVFLRNAFDKGLKMLHYPKTIVMHPEESSGRHMGSDEAFFASSARTHRFYGKLSYFWLLKYTLFMWKDGYIKFSEMPRKFKIGLAGISKYKELKRTGEIEQVYVD
ncbi:glycosyltransferase [Winogradskyella sp. 3972H.M.0a.05]|uniref:glycosyltransferase family 2 protein n=1 Tax=Winogradskyella sp. 3972H.M.0a.05 TaxID=2950277 RepID=UPI003393E0C8